MGQTVRGTPGVYVRGVPSEPALQLSAITGFVGIAARGPLHHPEPIRSWDEYLTVFGGFLDHAYLPHAVFGFFRNGGAKCFVVRVADMLDHSAENPANFCPRIDLLRAATNVSAPPPDATPINDHTPAETLRVSAINEGSWANELTYELRLGSQRHMPLTKLTAPASTGATTLAVESVLDLEPNMEIRLAPPGNPFGVATVTVQAVNAATNVVTLTVALGAGIDLPRGADVLGRGFKLIVHDGDRIEIFDNLSVSDRHPRSALRAVNGPDEAMPYTERQARGHSIAVQLSRVGSPGFRPVVPSTGVLAGKVTGGGDGFRYASVLLQSATALPSIRLMARAVTEKGTMPGTLGHELRVRAQPFGTLMALPAAAAVDHVFVEDGRGLQPNDPVTLTDAANIVITETLVVASIGPDNRVTFAGPLANSYTLGSAVTVQGRFTLSVFRGAAIEPSEVHRNLSADPASGTRYFRTRIADDSTLICGDGPNILVPPPDTLAGGDVFFAGGRDPGGIDFRWYTGYDDKDFFQPLGFVTRRLGLATLESVEEVDLVAVPDLAGQSLLADDAIVGPDAIYRSAFRQILYHAAKLGDRMALLETRAGLTLDQVVTVPAQLADPQTAKFGALYYPWLKTTAGGRERPTPPSGFIAGVIARADREGGAGRAPANFPLKEIVDLEVLLTQDDQDALNLGGINCARKFEQPAIEVWGARTLSADPDARYLNVRRLLIVVKKAINRTLRWAVFEPEGPTLWQRIQASLQGLLQTLVTRGGTPADGGEAFFVKCDEETNPRAVRDLGQVVATIGLALTAPAEFIVLNVKRTPESVSVTEEGG